MTHHSDVNQQDVQFTYDMTYQQQQPGPQGQEGTLEVHAHFEEEQTQAGQYDEVTIQATYEQADGFGHLQQETFDASYQQFDAGGQGQQGMWNLTQQDPSALQSLQGYQQTQMQSLESVYQSQDQQQGTLDVLQTYQQGQDVQSWSLDATLQQQDLQGFMDTTTSSESFSESYSEESW